MKKYIALLSIDTRSISSNTSWKLNIIDSVKKALTIIWETDQFKKVGSLKLVNIVTEQKVREEMIVEHFPPADLRSEIAGWMDTFISSHRSKEAWTKDSLVSEAGSGDTFVIALLSKEGCRKIELATLEVSDILARGDSTLISSIKVFD